MGVDWFEKENLPYTWFVSLSFFSVVNIVVYLHILNRPYTSKHKAICRYEDKMRWLTLPYVVQCAWRSFWPEVYNTRVVFWDTLFNSCFIGRMLATIGEVTWVTQIALALNWAVKDIKELSKPGTISNDWERYIYHASWAAVYLCATAEFFCNHGMFVENCWYNIIEVSLWTIAMLLLIPCSIYLLRRLDKIKPQKGQRIDTYWTRRFLQLLLAVCVVFVGDATTDHIPM